MRSAVAQARALFLGILVLVRLRVYKFLLLGAEAGAGCRIFLFYVCGCGGVCGFLEGHGYNSKVTSLKNLCTCVGDSDNRYQRMS